MHTTHRIIDQSFSNSMCNPFSRPEIMKCKGVLSRSDHNFMNSLHIVPAIVVSSRQSHTSRTSHVYVHTSRIMHAYVHVHTSRIHTCTHYAHIHVCTPYARIHVHTLRVCTHVTCTTHACLHDVPAQRIAHDAPGGAVSRDPFGFVAERCVLFDS